MAENETHPGRNQGAYHRICVILIGRRLHEHVDGWRQVKTERDPMVD